MGFEIERKFLVRGDFGDEVTRTYRITQGYLCSTSGRTVRVRVRDRQGFLTIKGPGSASGMSRFEWEKEISLKEAEDLLALCGGEVLDKWRHLVPFRGHIFEVDEFLGENSGLTVAEVELASEDEVCELPGWVGREVTGDRRFYNSMLIANPYSNWKEEL